VRSKHSYPWPPTATNTQTIRSPSLSKAVCFDATDLGHPLVPVAKCVRNDVRLSHGKRMFLVSGSNMSGKSTLLRTVGINAVLAMAVARVRAQRLRLTPLHVGASIRVNDSLQEGSSRFYAEITRLRAIFDLAPDGGLSLLFLLDELLQDTNSNDRRIGAGGIVHALLNRGAIGLVSTHDLALAEISGSRNGRLHNVHFQENFANGRIHFDYKPAFELSFSPRPHSRSACLPVLAISVHVLVFICLCNT
jgi:DNA mismatch repair ATPase MutS